MDVSRRRAAGRCRLVAGAGAAAVVAGLLPGLGGAATAATPVPVTTVNDPPAAPHVLAAFPARDFLSAEGQVPGDTVVFEVTHAAERGGATVASEPLVVGADGVAEVNHAGAACWDVVTPNIVAGDTVRVVVTASPGGVRDGVAQVTHVADVVAGRPTSPAPGTVTVRGTARAEDGTPLALEALEGRLVAPGGTFSASGRRDLRAPGSPRTSLAYDEPGSTTNAAFTVTWTGLSDADVTLALGAEAIVSWAGRDPAAGTEATVHESGAGIANGPQAPCTAPREQLPPLPGEDGDAPSAPADLQAVVTDSNTVTLDWSAATDGVGVTDYGVYRNGVPVFTVQNPDASAPAPTGFVDRNVPPGTHTYTVDAGDAAGNRSAASAPVSAEASARPVVDVPVSNPPTHPVTIFPSRELVEVGGLTPGQQARVEVVRAGRVVSDSPVVADATGSAEVNHAGAHCWVGTTPEIRAGDEVRVTGLAADGSVAWVDAATVAAVTAERAVQTGDVVTVRGTAPGHDGRPLPVDQIEQRMVSSTATPFGVNGRRTLRADSSGLADGTLAYDPVGPDNPLGLRWTATYRGLDDTDRALAVAVESRAMWLGRDPLAGLELTIYEVGGGDPPGPAAPDCTAPFEPIDTQAPSVPVATATALSATREVVLDWAPSTDDTDVYGYRVLRDGVPVAAVGGGTTTFTDTGVSPGDHTYAVEAYDAASATGPGATDVERISAGLGRPYGNTSAPSPAVAVVLADVQPPGTPTGLTGTNPAGTTDAVLVFDPSADDSGAVALYRVYRDGVLLAEAAPGADADGRLTHTDGPLTPGATHRYAVSAVDAAGNESAPTAEVSVTIAPDVEAPVFTGTPSATVPDIHGRDVVVTWEAATDDLGVTGYGVYRDGARVAVLTGGTLSFTDSGLAPGTYAYQVDAVDSAGNRSSREAQPAQVAAVASDPPSAGHTVIGYPARDFVEGDGYAGAGPVTVEVFRADATGRHRVVGRAHTTPDATGLVEVNHSGPGCWGAPGFPNTPDLRAGDVVRITPDATGVPDQTTVQAVRVGRPAQTATGTVVVTGTAVAADGAPLPLDQLEARMISGTTYQANGRKMLRAPLDGTIAYDAPGSTAWTATFTGLSSADVTRALAGEMVVNWLGRSPLVGNELTIAENGPGTDGGPAGGTACTAPLDPTAPLAGLSPASSLAFGGQSAVPASTSAPRPVTLTNAGTSPLALSGVAIGGANPADFSLSPTALPATLAPGASVRVDVTFSPKAVGARSGTLTFANDAANTTYQVVQLTGTGTDAAAPSAPTGLTRALAPAYTMTGTARVDLSWTASTGTVARYELQRSVGGAAFAATAEQPGTATAVQVAQATGASTRYRVRACNGTNCSAWVQLAAFTLVGVQENAGSVGFRGTWTRAALAGSYGGSTSRSTAAGSSATLTTTGRVFQLVSVTGPDRGNAEVWVDGVRRGTVSLYAPTQSAARVVFTSPELASATHRVELRVLGARTAPSTGNRVDLDGFVVLR